MTKLECCIYLDLFLDSDLAERACCLDRICRPCLETSPKCLDCPNLPTKTVNLVQLEAEIQLVNEIAQEQAEFYDRWDCGLNRQSDAKAVSLVLELLEFLRDRLVISHRTNPDKTLLIPHTILVRSKDVCHGIVINSHGFSWHALSHTHTVTN